MANLIRSAKSGSDWTQTDLDAYHIEFFPEEPGVFFGINLAFTPPLVDKELLATVDAQAMQKDRNVELINLLDLAMSPHGSKGAVSDFVVELFKVLGYVRRDRLACTRKNLALLICGELRQVETDVCLVDRSQNNILLLVKEDKRSEDRRPVDTRAQLVAEAVAAFAENNKNRMAAGLYCLTEQVIPGIIMVGTSPTFFKIPVTKNLCTRIAHGTYPRNATCISYCVPPVPRPNRRHSEGMKPLDNRHQILSCYEAFKQVLGI
ncbi:hypothetical protein QCA50_000225 [Cerrena zonata]|uniref:Uncharacterized protein n=1 Tax=Cerrena zonata TaxID=2478898 RepID=A0AAW0GZR9_9APHY